MDNSFVNGIVDKCVEALKEQERDFQEVKKEILEDNREQWISRTVCHIFQSITQEHQEHFGCNQFFSTTLTKEQERKVNCDYNRLGGEITKEILDSIENSKMKEIVQCFDFETLTKVLPKSGNDNVSAILIGIQWKVKEDLVGKVTQGDFLELLEKAK